MNHMALPSHTHVTPCDHAGYGCGLPYKKKWFRYLNSLAMIVAEMHTLLRTT